VEVEYVARLRVQQTVELEKANGIQQWVYGTGHRQDGHFVTLTPVLFYVGQKRRVAPDGAYNMNVKLAVR
jgi:hypothetical protein